MPPLCIAWSTNRSSITATGSLSLICSESLSLSFKSMASLSPLCLSLSRPEQMEDEWWCQIKNHLLLAARQGMHSMMLTYVQGFGQSKSEPFQRQGHKTETKVQEHVIHHQCTIEAETFFMATFARLESPWQKNVFFPLVAKSIRIAKFLDCIGITHISQEVGCCRLPTAAETRQTFAILRTNCGRKAPTYFLATDHPHHISPNGSVIRQTTWERNWAKKKVSTRVEKKENWLISTVQQST